MATYRVTDPATGKTVKLTGDSPPTESELNEIFSSVSGPVSQSDPVPDSLLQKTAGAIRSVTEPIGEAVGSGIQSGLETAKKFPLTAPGAYGIETGLGAAGKVTNIFDKAGEFYAEKIPSIFEKVPDPLGIKDVSRPAVQYGSSLLGTGVQMLTDIASLGTYKVPRSALKPSLLHKTGSAVTRKGIKGLFAIPEKAQVRRFHRPDQVRNAPSFSDLGDKVSQSVNKMRAKIRTGAQGYEKAYPSFEKIGQDVSSRLNILKKKISDLDSDAWSTLHKLKSEPRDQITRILSDVRGDLRLRGGVIGPADKKAVGVISSLIDDIKSVGNKGVTKGTKTFLTAQDIRKIVQKFDDNINWQDPLSSTTNSALVEARVRINNLLRKNNPEFAPILDDLSNKIRLMDEASKSLSLKKIKGEFEPSNLTTSRLRSTADKSHVELQNLMDRLKKETEIDLRSQVGKATLKEQAERGQTADFLKKADPKLARELRLSEIARRRFGLYGDKELSDVLTPSDSTADALRRASREKSVLSRSVLEKMNPRLIEKIDDSAARAEFEMARPQGSARTILGGMGGMAVDTMLGTPGKATFLGGLGGLALDRFGGPIAGRTIDALSAFQRSPLGRFTLMTNSPTKTPLFMLGGSQVARNKNNRMSPPPLFK